MIGVVVWSNVVRHKAVIWCEDHAALAYLQGQDNVVTPDFWPEPGDLLEFETEITGNLRHARGVSLVSEQGGGKLPELLKDSTPMPQPSLKVVSINPGHGLEMTDRDTAPPIRIGAAR